MAHEVESGGTVKDRAWHGLGEHSDTPILQMDEALRLWGMDWIVNLEPVYLQDGTIVEGHHAVVRDKDQSALGIVKGRYVPLQNADAFAWFQPFVDSGQWEIRAGFSLKGGRVIALTAYYVGKDADILDGDTMRRYLILTHGHDGSHPVSVSQHNQSIVCMNTWRAWYHSDAPRIQFKHTEALQSKLEHFQKWMLRREETFGAEVDIYRRMASRRLNRDEFRAFVKLVLGQRADIAETADTAEDTKMPRAYDVISEAYACAPGADVRGATAWGAVNAVTFWADHIRGRGADTRMESALYGEGAEIKSRAVEVAYSMLD